MAAKDDDTKAIEQQQHTGNHNRPVQERAGNEKLGGTRAGQENVERKTDRQQSG